MDLKFEYLHEFDFIFKTKLVYESGGPGDSFGEKPVAKKSHASVPLTNDAKTIWVTKSMFKIYVI
jgi:CRP-like cAMP-binding protein